MPGAAPRTAPFSGLGRALDECAGKFQADCRGVGTDWSPAQLRAIADRLLGTVQLVADSAGLAQDFRATLGWLGDSRAYLLAPDGGRLLTRDHAWLAMVLERGDMPEAKARRDARAP